MTKLADKTTEQITETDIVDLVNINHLAKSSYIYIKFCYLVKSAFLKTYGENDGFDLQVFERESWHDDNGYFGDSDIFSTHKHILRRIKLKDTVFKHVENGHFSEADIIKQLEALEGE